MANKEITKLIREATRQSWIVVRGKSNHLRWESPNGGIVHTSSTPSDVRAVPNMVKDLQKHGFAEGKNVR